MPELRQKRHFKPVSESKSVQLTHELTARSSQSEDEDRQWLQSSYFDLVRSRENAAASDKRIAPY